MTALLRSRPFWRRRLLWPVVGLLGLNVAAFAVYTFPRQLQEKTLASHAVTLREEVERERAASEDLRRQTRVVGANTQDMQRFRKSVVGSRQSLSEILSELERMARDHGLQTDQRSYSHNDIEKLSLVRFQVQVPVAGSYRQLMSFLDALERSPRFVIVESVKYDDRSGGEPGLHLAMSTYLAKGVADAP
jgi:Tfp pilus assembly protein PilO